MQEQTDAERKQLVLKHYFRTIVYQYTLGGWMHMIGGGRQASIVWISMVCVPCVLVRAVSAWHPRRTKKKILPSFRPRGGEGPELQPNLAGASGSSSSCEREFRCSHRTGQGRCQPGTMSCDIEAVSIPSPNSGRGKTP